jgi:DNA-binding NarL/FixJ family response regulator
MINIVIVDDHALVREGIKKIIRSCKDIRLIGEAVSLEEVMFHCERSAPHLIVLDMSLPGYDGLEGMEKLRSRFPQIPVLILSMYPEQRFSLRALRMGAAGYIKKSMAAEELIIAIRRIMSTGAYVSLMQADIMAQAMRAPSGGAAHAALIEREQQVVSLMGNGKQIKHFAAELSISISSVNTYRTRIFKKLGSNSNAALMRYAVDRRLTQ